MKFSLDMVEKGDALLYMQRTSFVDQCIAVKTGFRFGHIEIYWGAGMSMASRNGIGVNRYQFRPDDLVCVRRANGPLDYAYSEEWFVRRARGQKYDFLGLLCFWLAVKRGSPDRMFCSEFALRWYRMAGFQPFNEEMDADRTAPSEFWKAASFHTVWQLEGFLP